MRLRFLMGVFVCVQTALWAGCGRQLSNELGDVRKRSHEEQNTRGDDSLRIAFASDSSAGLFSVGSTGVDLWGTCTEEGKVELQGDVTPGQSAECVDGTFRFPTFRLSEGDGKKSIFVSQLVSSGSTFESKRFVLQQDTKTVFKLPENALFQQPKNGAFDDAIRDVFSDGENVILSFVRGGLAVSRDSGKSWYHKTIANGLQSKSAIAVHSYNDVFYATSSQGLLTSKDFGRTWVKNPQVSSGAGRLHRHQERIFADFGAKSAAFTLNNGSNWTVTGDLPGTYPDRRWSSVGGSLFVTSSSDGVYTYVSDENKWIPFRPAGLTTDRKVVSVEGNEKIALAQVTAWPRTAQTQRTYLLSTDGGKSWREIYSSSNAFEELSCTSQHLLRYTLFANSFDLKISRDLGLSWEPLALPASLANQSPARGFAFFSTGESVVLRSQERLAMTTNPSLTEWRTFEIPEPLRGSKLSAYRVFNGKRFFIFEQGLIFSEQTLNQWSMFLVQPPTGPTPSGITARGRTIFTWSRASSFPPRGLGGLFMSTDGGASFENITPRLNLLDGFYLKNFEKQVQAGVSTLGYSLPVTGVALSERKIFVATQEGVSISLDGAQSFTLLKDAAGRPTPLPNDIQARGALVAIATQSAGLLLSRDEGKSWNRLTQATGLPSNNIQQVSLLERRILIRVNLDIYMSENFGVSWEKLSFLRNLPEGQLQSVGLCDGLVCVGTRKMETTPEGYAVNRAVLSISDDLGRTFIRMPAVPSVNNGGFRFENGEFFIASGSAVHVVSRDLSRSRILAELESSISGLAVSDGAVYISTFAGVFAVGAPTAVTLQELPQNVRLASVGVMNECLQDCVVSPPAGNVLPPASSTPAPAPVLEASQCRYNVETQRCDYSFSWTNAPAASCLWVREGTGVPRRWECPTSDKLQQGEVIATWLKSGTSYSVFLAREVSYQTAGAKLTEKIVFTDSPVPELNREPCTAFNNSRGTCTAKVSWKYAAKNSCLWAVHPLSGEVSLASCALAENPSGHSFNFQWLFTGYSNTLFLARQVAGNPNQPESQRSISVDWYQPTESPAVLSNSECTAGSSKTICTTVLTWNNIPLGGCLFFEGNSGVRPVACSGTSGSFSIPWITRGIESYFFVAERNKPTQKYAELRFTAPQLPLEPKLSATPCVPNSNVPVLCTTTISWTDAPVNSCVFVKTATGANQFACGTMIGSAVAPWVGSANPSATVFILADKSDPTRIYAEVKPVKP